MTKEEPDLTSALKFHLRTALPIKLARTNVVNITNVQHLTFNRTLHLLEALLFYLSVYTSAFFFLSRLRLFFSQENKQKKKKAVRVWELKCCHLHQNGTSPTIVEPGFRFKAVCVRVCARESSWPDWRCRSSVTPDSQVDFPQSPSSKSINATEILSK